MHAFRSNMVLDLFQLVKITEIAVRFDGPCGCPFVWFIRIIIRIIWVYCMTGLFYIGVIIHDMVKVIRRCLPRPFDLIICINAVSTIPV